MSHDGCNAMEVECLERAKTDAKNRGRWLAQAERWHELARVQTSWRLKKDRPNRQCTLARWLSSANRASLSPS